MSPGGEMRSGENGEVEKQRLTGWPGSGADLLCLAGVGRWAFLSLNVVMPPLVTTLFKNITHLINIETFKW